MATKTDIAAAAAAAGYEHPKMKNPEKQDVRIRFPNGAKDLIVDGEDIVITIPQVPVLNVHWVGIGRILDDGGLPPNEIDRYVDEFAERVTLDQLAKVLAHRIKLD